MDGLYNPPSGDLARRYSMESPHVKISQNLVTELVLQNNVQSRTSVMITAAFNVAAATVMIISIVYDAWRLSKRFSLDLQSKYGPSNMCPAPYRELSSKTDNL